MADCRAVDRACSSPISDDCFYRRMESDLWGSPDKSNASNEDSAMVC